MEKKVRLAHARGFTLIEILIVIGIIAILAGIVLVAINPARQFRQANNTQRQSNINAILNAIGQYAVDNKGNISALNIPEGDESEAEEISSSHVDLCGFLVPKYISALPADPLKEVQSIPAPGEDCDDTYNLGYDIYVNDTGRVTVIASQAEDVDNGGPADDPLTVTR